MAGLHRLGKAHEVTEAIPVDVMVPAVGQGALALQCRRDDASTKRILDSVHDERTAVCVHAERSFLTAVSGGCSAPAACHAVWDGPEVVATGVWAADERGPGRRLTLKSDPLHVVAMGRELARQLKA
jgi:hydroxymethylbilane synthase